MPTPTPSQTIRGYQREARQVREYLDTFARNAWIGLGSYREADINRLVSIITPRILAGELRLANLTESYLAALSGRAAQTVNAGVVSGDALRGVPVNEVYARPIHTVWSELSEGKPFSVARDAGLARLLSLISTDLQLAQRLQEQQSLIRGGYAYYRRTLTGMENCALCILASTQRYHRGDLKPIHPGCVPGDSVVTAEAGGGPHLADFAWGQLHAVSRRLFKGELVEFVTARGDQVRVTPNHPVLTEQGWLPADLLREGDAVFSTGGRQRIVAGGPNIGERPALIQDVFDTARVSFPLVRVPLAPEDFHADAAQGEVEIVYTNGHFPTPGRTERIEMFGEGGFMGGHGPRLALDRSRPLDSLAPGGFPSGGGNIGRPGLGDALFGGHLAGTIHSGGRVATRFDAPAEQFTLESAPVYTSRGLDLQRRLARDVECDRIVKLRRIGWSDHVYNLHTFEGWYSSNSHIVSNCDCGVAQVAAGEDPGQVLNDELLETIHETVGGDFQYNRSGRSVTFSDGTVRDYKDIVIRQHGEYGPTLTWRNQQFTGPGDLAA